MKRVLKMLQESKRYTRGKLDAAGAFADLQRGTAPTIEHLEAIGASVDEYIAAVAKTAESRKFVKIAMKRAEHSNSEISKYLDDEEDRAERMATGQYK